MARESLLAVAGLVSVHDDTWTTDRRTAAQRWGEIRPEHSDELAQMLSWTSGSSEKTTDVIVEMLQGAVAEIVSAFDDLIGLWPRDGAL